jgi:hypothetical protein
MQLQGAWIAQIMTALRQARDDGELPPDADLEQLAFEITAMMFRANFTWIVTEDEGALNLARAGIRNVMSRVAEKTQSKGRARRPEKKV